MEITLMDSGRNIFVLYEFIEYINAYIKFIFYTCESTLDEFIWNPYRFPISFLDSPTFFLRTAKRER
jgi:hypothetical protein